MLLQRLTDGGRNLWAVGDARQAIYRFRCVNMSRFATAGFPAPQAVDCGSTIAQLLKIVGAFSNFGSGMRAGSGDASLYAERPTSGISSEHVTFGDNDDESDALADEIMRFSPHIAYRDQAVLCPATTVSPVSVANWSYAESRRSIWGICLSDPRSGVACSVFSLLVDRRAMGLVRKPSLPELATGLSLGLASAVVEHLRRTEARPACLGIHHPVIAGSAKTDIDALAIRN